MKKIMAIVFGVAIGLSLVSCAKTPDKKVVVDKSEGLAKENILEKETKTPKDLKVPSHWTETMNRNEDYVTINADCDITIPEVYNTPVYSYEMKSISNKQLKKLCDYFSEGKELYQEPAMTKEQLKAEKEKITNKSATWSNAEASDITMYGQVLDEMMEKAPDQKDKKAVKAEFRAPIQSDQEYLDSQMKSASTMYSEYYYETDKKIGLKVRVDQGNEYDPKMQAINYNEKLGSTSKFVYSQGTYYDGKNIQRMVNSQEVFDEDGSLKPYLDQLQEMMNQSDPSYTQEDAKKDAQRVLYDLGLKGYTLVENYRAIGNSDIDSWAGLVPEEITSQGYSFYYSVKVGDVSAYEQPFQRPYDGLPETSYAPSFSTEMIQIILTKDGIQKFAWTNMAKKKDTIAENTRLMSFDEIKEKMADHVMYMALSANGEESKSLGYKCKVNIEDVQLRAANIPAYEDSSAVWIVPVWVFKVNEEVEYPDMGLVNFGKTYIVLNAIDGGYVRPCVDTRIELP